MKTAGIFLLLASAVLLALGTVGFVAPLVWSFTAIASAETPLRPEDLSTGISGALNIPLLCLAAAVLTAVPGLVLVVTGSRKRSR